MELGSRRNLLLAALSAGFAATIGAVFYPVVRFLWPRKATVSGAQEIVAPFALNQLPNAPGNPFNFGGKPCLVIVTPEGQQRLARGEKVQSDDVRAFSALCTHVDCTVQYRPGDEDIFCNCHNGVYDLQGRNISGPPPRPLESYKVTLRGNPGEEEIIVSRES